MASSGEKPSSRKWCSASRRRMPFFATMPITMIIPIKEATLNVVRVTRSASKPPKVESNADARMAAGAENVRNSNGSNATSKIRALQASGDLNDTLKILAPNFRLPRFRGERGQRTERSRAAGGTGDQGIAHAVEGRTALLGKADANRICAIVENHGRGRRLAFQNGGGVQCDFFRREPGAGSNSRIHLICNGGTASGVFDAV